jgi:hypothetical protein
MAQVDAGDPTPTDVTADLVDIYRIAARELRAQGFHNAEPDEVLELAKWLASGF